jgi:hypothetical protein
MRKFKNTILILGLLLISSCSIFQSKYVEIEVEDGGSYDYYDVELLENKVIQVNDTDINHLTFTFVNTEEPEIEFGIYIHTIKLKSESINYELKFDFDNQESVFVEKNNYDIYIINEDPNINLNKMIGTIELKKGEKREIKIGTKIQTVFESYSTTKKVLRSELRKNKKKE